MKQSLRDRSSFPSLRNRIEFTATAEKMPQRLRTGKVGDRHMYKIPVELPYNFLRLDPFAKQLHPPLVRPSCNGSNSTEVGEQFLCQARFAW
jgi:hypothetical protein